MIEYVEYVQDERPPRLETLYMVHERCAASHPIMSLGGTGSRLRFTIRCSLIYPIGIEGPTPWTIPFKDLMFMDHHTETPRKARGFRKALDQIEQAGLYLFRDLPGVGVTATLLPCRDPGRVTEAYDFVKSNRPLIPAYERLLPFPDDALEALAEWDRKYGGG